MCVRACMRMCVCVCVHVCESMCVSGTGTVGEQAVNNEEVGGYPGWAVVIQRDHTPLNIQPEDGQQTTHHLKEGR